MKKRRMEYTRAIILLATCSSQVNVLQIRVKSYAVTKDELFFASFHEPRISYTKYAVHTARRIYVDWF